MQVRDWMGVGVIPSTGTVGTPAATRRWLASKVDIRTTMPFARATLQVLGSYYDWGNVTTVWAWGANGTANPTNFTSAITGTYLVPYNG